MKTKTYLVSGVLLLLVFILSACAPVSASIPEQPSAPVVEQPAPAEVQPTAAVLPAPPVAPVAPVEAPTAETAGEVVLPEVDAATLSGDIYSAGSSTVYPLSEQLVLMFSDQGFTGENKLDSIGSGAGIERFCKSGESDIANASRKIKDSEVESCAAINRTPIEFRVGTDALAIVVSTENDFITNVSMEELAKIFSSEAVLWSDIDPAYPAEPIQRFVPGTDSGTYDYFIESVMLPVYGKEDETNATKVFLEAKNLSQSEDDNVLVQGVEGSKYAIGFFGYAYYNENTDKLKTLSVDGVTPSFDSAESGEYKIARPLYIYSDAGIMKSKPQVAAFINFYLTHVNEVISEVGYFPASADALDASRQAWLDATK